MATYKILGQSAPTNTSNADLYTVGSGKSAVISSLVITNTTTSATTARVFVRPAGASASAANAIVYDLNLDGTETIALTLGITLAATDVVSVRTATANALTFHAFGQEN